MQLATQTKDPDQKMSPAIYAALIDSLSRTRADVRRRALRGGRRGHDGVKTGNALAVAMRCLLVIDPAPSAPSTCAGTRSADRELTAGGGRTLGDRYQIGAMLYAVALGLWCMVALLGSNDAVAHMICMSVTTVLHGGGRRPDLRTAVDLPGADRCWPAGRWRWRWR